MVWLVFNVDCVVKQMPKEVSCPSAFPEQVKLKVVLQAANWELDGATFGIESLSDFGTNGESKPMNSRVFINTRITRDPSFFLFNGHYHLL